MTLEVEPIGLTGLLKLSRLQPLRGDPNNLLKKTEGQRTVDGNFSWAAGSCFPNPSTLVAHGGAVNGGALAAEMPESRRSVAAYLTNLPTPAVAEVQGLLGGTYSKNARH